MVAAPGQAVVPGQTTQSGQQPQLLFNPAAAVMQQPGMTFTPPNLGMNLQQLQQIQLAQQIMASTGGAAAANPLAAMAAANPLVAQQAMMAAGLMMNPQLQQQMQQTMQQQQSRQVVVGQPQLAQALPGQVASGLVAVAGTPTATTTTTNDGGKFCLFRTGQQSGDL